MSIDPNVLAALISNRRTITPENYSNREVEKEIITVLLESAKWAPTHGKTEPWRFTVFHKEGVKQLAAFQAKLYQEITPEEKFSEKKYNKLKVRPTLSSCIIAIGMRRQPIEKIPEIEEVEAVACAVQNMSLMATSYGLGTFWSSGGMTYQEKMKSFLGLTEKDQVLGFLYVGYPKDEWPTSHRKPVDEYTSWKEG